MTRPDDGQGAGDEMRVDLGAIPSHEPSASAPSTGGPAADGAAKGPPTLAAFLPDLLAPRPPAEAGGVLLPEAWECVRAIFGGASRKDLELAHQPSTYGTGADADRLYAYQRVQGYARQDGTHLPSGLHVITGQTGGGKSALVMNLTRAAIGAGHPVVYVTLELDGVELAARLLGLDAGLPWWKLAQRRELDPTSTRLRTEGVEALRARAGLVTVLAPSHAPTLAAEVRAAAHASWRAHRRTPLVVFDYLQAAADLPGGEYRAQLREYVGAVARELRELSRVDHTTSRDDSEFWPGCPVVALSITARSSTRGQEKVPGLDGADPDKLRRADLETLKALPKEAGAVEAYAVTSWALALAEEPEPDGRRRMTLRLAKGRGWLPGQWVPFVFNGHTGTLAEDVERYALAAKEDRDDAAAASERRANGASRGSASNGVGGAPTRRVIE